jgi:glucan phosphoethanolaminetransferase (alkaline phosphatase superfamily)
MANIFFCIITGIMLSFIYIAFGGFFCPTDIEKRWVAMLIIAFWPIYLALLIISLPFLMLYYESDEIVKKNKKKISNYDARSD